MAHFWEMGETLGQKHLHYNKSIKEAIMKGSLQKMEKINYDDPDIDNLYKIDIACIDKNIEYIIEVFKCEDMLYVSRALKKSVWLITEKEYSHIINPYYLDSQLLRQMTSKAGHKLLLTIRLHLKDEERVEEFFNYYKEKSQLQVALKWLQNCSLPFIESVVQNHAKHISSNLILRLSKKSFKIFEHYIQEKVTDKRKVLSNATLFLNDSLIMRKFLEEVLLDKYYVKFSAKATQKMLKGYPDIILDNFEIFVKKIHIPTLSNSLHSDKIISFLLRLYENKHLRYWFKFENLKHFIARIPSDERFVFVKSMFIDKKCSNNEEDLDRNIQCAPKPGTRSSNANIYRWYIYAPFETAFIDLKKLIRAESNPNERNAMFAVLVACAGRNLQNIQTILQYYRDKHMNEPLKFKSHFINILLSASETHRFDNVTWGVLNEIFCSMEVYSENTNTAQSCVRHIIVFKVVHGENIPDIIVKKFEFDTLKSFQSKLDIEEQEKVFNYLYQYMSTKIQNFEITYQSNLRKAKHYIINILSLLIDWNRDLLDHIIIVDKIRQLIEIKSKQSWNEDLSDIYNVKKSWKKHMFAESIKLHPTQETLINALKHGPQVIANFKGDILINGHMLLRRLLNKLRIYWPLTLGRVYQDKFLQQLCNNNVAECKISVQGLCILLPQKELKQILLQYKPNDVIINWENKDELSLSIQKNLGKYMYLGRPQPSLDIVLFYAKGDYLQYTLPSLLSILNNMSVERSINYIQKLLDVPVSLQKHGLRFAFNKLKTDELLNICPIIWQSAQNASIRATVFKIVFDSLCKEQDVTKIKHNWHVLSTFIDDLTPDENKVIYVTLGNAHKVPLSVKQDYCIKSYRYLKSLPAKNNCDTIMKSVLNSTLDIMETMDDNFIIEVVFDSFNKHFTRECYDHIKIISAFLISTKSETVQTERYNKFFIPLLTKYLELINSIENQFHLRRNISALLLYLLRDCRAKAIENNMITPKKLFNNIYNNLKENLSHENNYLLILTWKLATEYINIIDKLRSNHDSLHTGNLASVQNIESCSKIEDNKKKCSVLYLKAASDFGVVCMAQLRMEMEKNFSTIYLLFSKALEQLFDIFQFALEVKLLILTTIQDHSDIIHGHLLVLQMVPNFFYIDEEIEALSKIYDRLECHPSIEVRIHYQQMKQDNESYKNLYN